MRISYWQSPVDGKWYWRLDDLDDKTLAKSTGYEQKSQVKRDLARIKNRMAKLPIEDFS